METQNHPPLDHEGLTHEKTYRFKDPESVKSGEAERSALQPN